MRRRRFLATIGAASGAFWPFGVGAGAESPQSTAQGTDTEDSSTKSWLPRWEEHILGGARSRYCDKETGEELGWLVSPFLNGFYYGYLATRNERWLENLTDWADAWIRRGVKEPDGFLGWPKSGTGGMQEKEFHTDSLLGEAMALRPLVLMAGEIQKNSALKARFGTKADSYLKLGENTFEKWKARGCWREVKDGGVWVVPAFGIDQQTGRWTEGNARRNTEGLTHPANKQNQIARWVMAMHDATQKPVYRDHARQWWQVMKSRMRTRESGKYFVWNYWDPAGPWDFNPDGTTRHWVGVHPNGGYYELDLEGIVAAFEHGVVFTPEDLQRLIATNRDFMWNQQITGAKFQRIDGGEVDPRWKDSPGTLWAALVPHDKTLRKVFVANNDPASWGGLVKTPWFMARLRS